MQPREKGLVSKKPVGTLEYEYLVKSVPPEYDGSSAESP